MSNGLGLMIESLVAVLLLLTIGFCVVLNNRLKKLKADEHALKGTISELITATEIAERAIVGLKLTVRDCDQNLSEQLRAGEALANELRRQVEAGSQIMTQLAQITMAVRPAAPATPPAKATAEAASAFAARQRQRLNTQAA